MGKGLAKQCDDLKASKGLCSLRRFFVNPAYFLSRTQTDNQNEIVGPKICTKEVFKRI
jgi:hypothetical protein